MSSFKVVDRRTVLKQMAGAVAAGTLASGSVQAAAPTVAPARPAQQELGSYLYARKIWVRLGDRVFTCYRADTAQKYPYFYPVIGPASGLPLTDETGEPWPHHRSLYLGCDRVNGGNYWQDGLERGQIISRGPKLEQAKGTRIAIVDSCDWRQPDKEPILEDARRFSIVAPGPDVHLIDADITLTARTDVRIANTNHSFFSVRAARDMAPLGGGKLIDAHGRVGEKATFGQAAPWCGFEATRLGVPESIVLMHHPDNPWPDARWFTRDYGFMSPTPFQWVGEKGWTLPAGKAIRIRYRVAALKGLIDGLRVNQIYQEFVAAAG
ncbi:MAG: PmoA family protein [Phycisphaerae bacterium]|nr:PmoA family protein [Phycisphaerae bacterium]